MTNRRLKSKTYKELLCKSNSAEQVFSQKQDSPCSISLAISDIKCRLKSQSTTIPTRLVKLGDKENHKSLQEHGIITRTLLIKVQLVKTTLENNSVVPSKVNIHIHNDLLKLCS